MVHSVAQVLNPLKKEVMFPTFLFASVELATTVLHGTVTINDYFICVCVCVCVFSSLALFLLHFIIILLYWFTILLLLFNKVF